MKPTILPLITAVSSVIIHFGLTIITIFAILYELYKGGDYATDQSRRMSSSVVMLVLLAIAIIVELTVLVSSICLIVGIKKYRSSYIAAWLYLTVAYMILSFADFVGGYNALGFLFPIKLAVFILHLAMWYPIFRFLRISRATNNVKTQDKDAKVESAIYPQLAGVDYNRQAAAGEPEKPHDYTRLS